MSCFSVCAITISILFSVNSFAGEQSEEEALAGMYGDEEMVSIATGTTKPIYRAPAVASVITAEDIAAMGARHLDEILEAVPGLHVSRSTSGRLDSVFGIRGIATTRNPQTLVLINGFRFNSLANSSHFFNFRLPSSAIERIEVLRGPGSAVYGADAYAGVINVITKTGKDIDADRLAVRHGSFESEDALVQWRGNSEDWSLALSVESQRSAGDKSRRVNSDLQSILDAVFGTSASLAPGTLQTNYDVIDSHLSLNNANWKFHFWNWRLDGAGYGAGGTQALDPVGYDETDLNLFDFSYDRSDLSPSWHMGLRYSYQKSRIQANFQLLPPGTVVPIGADGNVSFTAPQGIVLFPDGLLGNPGATDSVHYAEAFAEYSGLADHQLRFGLGGRHEKSETRETKNFGPGVIDGTQAVVDGTLTNVTGTSFIYQPDNSRSVSFMSVQDEWALGKNWELTAGLRYDAYSDFGGTTNPRFALVWSADTNLTSKFLYGRAFRAPSFNESFIANNPINLGNPKLDPETIDTLELAFDYRTSPDLIFALSLFDYKARDLIELVQDTNGSTKTAQNARDQDGQGFELEMSWSWSDAWLIKTYYAYQDSTDARSGKAIAEAPRHHLYANLNWRLVDNCTVSTQANWIADRQRAELDPRSDIDDYTWVDLTLRATGLARHWDIAVSIRNALDEDARDPSDGVIPDDYPLEQRSVWVELGFRFGERSKQ